MIYRKTWFDYVLWAVYAGACIILLAYVGNRLWVCHIGEPLAGLGAFAPFLVLSGLYPGIRITSRAIRKKHHFSVHFFSMAEALAISVSFVFGTILRIREGLLAASIHEMGYAFEPGDYYELAKVRAGGGGFSFPHGMSDLYVNSLRGVLSFLGNSVAAAILFQVFLQVVAMVFAYLAVRKAAGRFVACTVLMVLAFSPSFILKVDAINPECLLTALFLAGLYLVISFVKASLAGRLFYGGLPGAFLLGAFLGFLCYLEAGCFVLFLFLAGLFTGKIYGNVERKQQIGKLLIVIVGGIAGFLGAIAEDASLGGVIFYQGLTWWADTYFHPNVESMRLLAVIRYPEYLFFAFLFLAAAFVVFEFFKKGREQDFSLWFLPCLLVTPAFFVDATVAGFGVVMFFFWSVMAGLGLKSVLYGGQAELVREKIEEINAAVKDSEAEADMAKKAPEPVPVEKPRFIENPLPLPKKHVKREMDYDYSIAEADMHYDLDIAAGDDFDR